MNTTGLRAVTLDVGGTLLHPFPSVGEVYSETLADHGFDVPPDSIEKHFEKAFEEFRVGPRPRVNDKIEKEFWRELVFRLLGPFCSQSALPTVFEDLYEAFARASRWEVAAGAFEIIEWLRARGLQVAILSNADTRLRGVLEAKGFTEKIETIFISAEVGFEKPDPRIFHHAEGVLEVTPGQVLHVGDSTFHDLRGAQEAGWSCLLLAGEFAPEQGRIRQLTDIRLVLGP